MWKPTEASILDHQALSANCCLAPWVLLRGAKRQEPMPLGRARKPQLKWSNCHLLAGSSPWLQVNLLTLPSPIPLVTGEDDEAWGTSIWPRNPQPREWQIQECWEMVGLRTRLWTRPSQFSEDYTRPPGRPSSSLLGKAIGGSQKSEPFGDWPRAMPCAERRSFHPGRKGAQRTRKVSWEAGGAGGPGFTPGGEPGPQLCHGRGQAPPTSLRMPATAGKLLCNPLGALVKAGLR